MPQYTLLLLSRIRAQLRRELRGFPAGYEIRSSTDVYRATGAEVTPGLFVDDKGYGKNHCWNTTADGTILDLTPSQFGNFPDIAIVSMDSPMRSHYIEGQQVPC